MLGAYLLTMTAMSSSAIAASELEITANGGAVTQYIFRGVPQSDGKAAAQGGIDLGISGFYAGTWISQVDTSARTPTGDVPASGLEYDLYAGYGFDVKDFSFGVGGTGYFYTDDFDETYVELNLSASWKWISVDYAIGSYDQQPTDADYTFLSVKAEYKGFFGQFGAWGDEFNGDYLEIGYGNTLTVADKDLFDYTFALIRSDKDLSFKVDSNGNPTDDTFFYAGVVKTFDLFGK